jgi:hypothetical protein
MTRTLAVTFALALSGGSTLAAGANALDGRPYAALPDCPNVRQYVGLVNDYRRKKRTGENVGGLADRLIALGDAYHQCARDKQAAHIVDPETVAPAQHHIAAEAALVYYDVVVQISTLFDVIPKARWGAGTPYFVQAGHGAIVDAKYVLDRSDDDTDKAHANAVVAGVGKLARKYFPKRYDEIMELKPEDIRD